MDAQHEIKDFAEGNWTWTREPEEWSVTESGDVRWRSHAQSDFWRTTEGVAPAHDGNAYLTPVVGDFEMQVTVTGEFSGLYDQVGAFLQSDDRRWLKAGVELDGSLWLSAVHTREESDWSRESWTTEGLTIRVWRHDGTVEAAVEDGERGSWRNFRVLHLPGPALLGVYSCSPKGAGFVSTATRLMLRVPE